MNKYDVSAFASIPVEFSIEAESLKEAERLAEDIKVLISVQLRSAISRIIDIDVPEETNLEVGTVDLVREPGDPDYYSDKIECPICQNHGANLIDKAKDEFVFECSWCGEEFIIKKDDFIQRL